MNTKKYLASIWLLFLLVIIVIFINKNKDVVFGKFPIESNIFKLLPSDQQNPILDQAFQKVSKKVDQKIIFILSNKNENLVIQTANTLKTALKNNHSTAQINLESNQFDFQKIFKNLFGFRYQLIDTKDRELILTDPNTFTEKTIQKIYSPFSNVSSEELKSDPFLLFRTYILNNLSFNTNFVPEHGYLIQKKNNQNYILMTGSLQQSSYDKSSLNAALKIKDIVNKLKQDTSTQIFYTGTVFYAQHGITSAQNEIQTIGLGSLIGIILLFICVFKKFHPLALTFISLLVGFLCGFIFTDIIFNEVHIFSIVFGMSLIGISVDYSFFFFANKLYLGNQWTKKSSLENIITPISLGLLTCIVGFLCLMWTPFPGFHQLSIFAIFGLTGSFITVILWYPFLNSQKSKTNVGFLTTVIQRWLQFYTKKLQLFLLMIFILLSLYGLINIKFNDDIQQLQSLPINLTTMTKFIEKVTNFNPSFGSFLVTGESVNSLLRNNELLTNNLQNEKIKYLSLTQLIPSEQTQKMNFEIYQKLIKNNLSKINDTLKISPPIKMSDVLANNFQSIPLDILLLNQKNNPLNTFWLGKIGNKYASLIVLNQPITSKQIQLLTANPNVFFLNKAKSISQVFKEYRKKFMYLFCISLIMVFLILIIRYGFFNGFKTLIPPLIACLSAIGISSLIFSNLNIFNLIPLTLILGIGIDYSLFFREMNKNDNKHICMIFLATTLSAITTLLSFGLLSLSETEAIQHFGFTIVIGIIVAWLLAPLSSRNIK